MNKIESFELDHTKVIAPFIRLAKEEEKNNVFISKYDVRFLQPNTEAITTSAIHTLEHLLATYLREEIDGIIDFSPMGCRTGFYLIIWDKHDINDIVKIVENSLYKVLDNKVVPATTKKECGNYKDHSLFSAKEYVKDVLDKGISIDPYKRIYVGKDNE